MNHITDVKQNSLLKGENEMEKKENLIKNVLAGLIGKKVSSEMELSREEVVR